MNNKYKTTDLPLCAVLCCLGYQFINIDRSNPSKVVFEFKQDERIEQIINEYWSKAIKIEPLDFFNQLKALKARIYSV